MDQRRSDRRYERRVEVEFSHEGQRYSGVSENISLGGMYILTGCQLPFGARVDLSFSIPTQAEPIHVMAQVRWSGTPSDPKLHGIGLRFDGLRARDVWALNKFFDQP